VGLLALAVVGLQPPPAQALDRAVAKGDPAGCAYIHDPDEPMTLSRDGTLILPPVNIAWQLPDNPTWREDPFTSKAWRIRYQSLRYVHSLFNDWCATGDDAVLDRAEFLLRDWHQDNPIGAAAKYAWYDHPVSWRTVVLVRGAGLMPDQPWLHDAIELHASYLVDNYGGVGNHALNENLGLLAASCFIGRQDWIDTAERRINKLLERSVSPEGVSNEQAIAYQEYNYRLYTKARADLLACGRPEPALFSRVLLMPEMLAHATLPNGQYEMLGNTKRQTAASFPGTHTVFTASQGAAGSPPPSTVAVYKAGFAFARTGWGETTPYNDEVMMTLRYGPGRAMHGHDDGGAVTLYGFGSRLLLDPGKNSWHNRTETWPVWVASRAAHNVVTVDGLAYRSSTTTYQSNSVSPQALHMQLSNSGYTGVTNVRSVLFSRLGGYVIVDDRLTADQPRTFRQLWHLNQDARPAVAASRVRTRSSRGNLEIRQLMGAHNTRVLTGSTDPLQGWLTYDYQTVIAAPVVEQIKVGTSARYLTLLVPFDDMPTVSTRVLQQWSDGYKVEVTVNGLTERIKVRGGTVIVNTVTDGT